MPAAEFGKRLKLVMEQRGETPQSIAAKLHITPQAVHKWMRGAEITLPNLRALAGALNVNWLWLRYGENVVMELMPPTQGEDPVETYRKTLIASLVDDVRRKHWLCEVLGVAVYEVDVTTGAYHWSASVRKMLKVPGDAQITRDLVMSILTPESVQVVQEAQRRCMETGARQWGRVAVKVAPDEVCDFMVDPMRDQEEHLVRLIGIVRRHVAGGVNLADMVAAK